MQRLLDRSAKSTLVRALAAAGLVLLLAGIVVATLVARGSNGDQSAAPEQTTTARTAAPPARPRPKRPPPLRAVALSPVGAYDPDGDGNENDELAPAAVDRNPTTSWRTERYSSFFKNGVGLVLDARRPAAFARLIVSSDTPGFVAQVQVATRPDGPFRAVSSARTVSRRTVFPLRRARARYLLVWITNVPDGTAAHITEVRALARMT